MMHVLRKGSDLRAAAGLCFLAVLALAVAACGSGSAGGGGGGSGGGGGGKQANVTTPIPGTQSQLTSITQIGCGSKKMTVALADGFGGNSWRKITRAEFENEAAKCPNIKTMYTDAQNDPQKAISDINSLVAQGVNGIITFPDAGPALLPAIRKATQAGVDVVPYVATVGGSPGVDYTAQVSEDVSGEGATLATWMVKALHGKGNVIFLGGTPGNSYSSTMMQGAVGVISKNPGMHMLNKQFIVTNWDVGNTQRVVAGLLTQYPKIDGVMTDYGGGSVGGIRAFIAAHRPLVPWTANDDNQFSCMWIQYHKSNPNFQIGTASSRNWMSAVALRRVVAAYQGKKDPEPTLISLPLFEDSIAGGSLAPKCVPSLPPDAIVSSGLTTPQLKALFK